MTEPAAGAAAVLRASLSVGGKSLAEHQLAAVLALKCGRVICFVRALGNDILGLQRLAERAGAGFHVATAPAQIASLVTAGDELFVVTDGVLFGPQFAADQLGGGPSVLVQSVESGLPAGFERIDLNHTAAGALCLPGRLVERLNELPADVDPASALTRIALQAGVPMQAILPEMRVAGGLMLLRDEADAQRAEREWFERHLEPGRSPSLGTGIARNLVRRFGPSLLDAGKGGLSVELGSVALLVLALIVGWFGHGAAALALVAGAWVSHRAAAQLTAIERTAGIPDPALSRREPTVGWLLDVGLILIAAWTFDARNAPGWQDKAFGMAMLVALLRLLPRLSTTKWIAWLTDRAVLALVLTAAAAVGMLAGVVQSLALGLAALGLLGPSLARGLTRA